MCFPNLFAHDRIEPQNTGQDQIIETPAGATQRRLSTKPPQNEIGQLAPVVEISSDSATQPIDDNEAPVLNAVMSVQSTQNNSSSSPLKIELIRQQLRQQLRDARISCGENFIYFVPVDLLERLITTVLIEEEIRDAYSDMEKTDAQTHAQRIKNSAMKLFAIYALRPNANGASIRFLIETELSDEDLPLQARRINGGWSLSHRDSKQHIEAFNEWDNENVEEFARVQWWMVPPVFDKDNHNCLVLEDEHILPFIPVEEDEKDDEVVPHMKVGGYSEVTAYHIHPAYHNFWRWDKSIPPVWNLMIILDSITNSRQEKQPLIADKKLVSCDKREFLKEKTILVALGAQNHPYLIRLLATYRKKKFFHLIFPCADSNLRVFWRNNPKPNFDREIILWSIKQMLGIANGLYQIHKFEVKYDLDVQSDLLTPVTGARLSVKEGEEKYGRHGDIKAENLLYFKDENVLKITDFGLGRFHGRDSRSGIDPRKVAGTLTYEPPECTIGKPVSRVYDIWSMGCLYLEFVTWLLEGNDKIEEFSNARGKPGAYSEVNDDNFFTVTNEYAEVRDAVIQWVDGLHAHKKCSQLIHDLVDFIMGHMLKVNTSERVEAEGLKTMMRELVEKAESNDKYLIEAAPRPARKPSTRRSALLPAISE